MKRPKIMAATLSAIFVVAIALSAHSQSPSPGEAGGLRNAVDRLAATHGFAVQGLETIENEPAPDASGTPQRRIEMMLSDYSYMLVRKPGGGVESLVIMGRKRRVVPPPEDISVETSRRGAHHIVIGVLAGPDDDRVTVPMIVDTGASTIVLPSSLIERLGFAAEDLTDGIMETANRRVRGKKAVLASVAIGETLERDVAVTFIDDDRLGGTMLLGMSFLGRYRVTIDDAENRIVLGRAR